MSVLRAVRRVVVGSEGGERGKGRGRGDDRGSVRTLLIVASVLLVGATAGRAQSDDQLVDDLAAAAQPSNLDLAWHQWVDHPGQYTGCTLWSTHEEHGGHNHGLSQLYYANDNPQFPPFNMQPGYANAASAYAIAYPLVMTAPEAILSPANPPALSDLADLADGGGMNFVSLQNTLFAPLPPGPEGVPVPGAHCGGYNVSVYDETTNVTMPELAALGLGCAPFLGFYNNPLFAGGTNWYAASAQWANGTCAGPDLHQYVHRYDGPPGPLNDPPCAIPVKVVEPFEIYGGPTLPFVPITSFIHPTVVDDVRFSIETQVRHWESQSIVKYWGLSGEFDYANFDNLACQIHDELPLTDYSPSARDYFEAWLAARYQGNVAELNGLWYPTGTHALGSFAALTIPADLELSLVDGGVGPEDFWWFERDSRDEAFQWHYQAVIDADDDLRRPALMRDVIGRPRAGRSTEWMCRVSDGGTLGTWHGTVPALAAEPRIYAILSRHMASYGKPLAAGIVGTPRGSGSPPTPLGFQPALFEVDHARRVLWELLGGGHWAINANYWECAGDWTSKDGNGETLLDDAFVEMHKLDGELRGGAPFRPRIAWHQCDHALAVRIDEDAIDAANQASVFLLEDELIRAALPVTHVGDLSLPDSRVEEVPIVLVIGHAQVPQEEWSRYRALAEAGHLVVVVVPSQYSWVTSMTTGLPGIPAFRVLPVNGNLFGMLQNSWTFPPVPNGFYAQGGRLVVIRPSQASVDDFLAYDPASPGNANDTDLVEQVLALDNGLHALRPAAAVVPATGRVDDMVETSVLTDGLSHVVLVLNTTAAARTVNVVLDKGLFPGWGTPGALSYTWTADPFASTATTPLTSLTLSGLAVNPNANSLSALQPVLAIYLRAADPLQNVVGQIGVDDALVALRAGAGFDIYEDVHAANNKCFLVNDAYAALAGPTPDPSKALAALTRLRQSLFLKLTPGTGQIAVEVQDLKGNNVPDARITVEFPRLFGHRLDAGLLGGTIPLVVPLSPSDVPHLYNFKQSGTPAYVLPQPGTTERVRVHARRANGRGMGMSEATITW
jgi:hypothetical protein